MERGINMKQVVEYCSRFSFTELGQAVKKLINEYNTKGYKLTNISHAHGQSGKISCMYSAIMIFENES